MYKKTYNDLILDNTDGKDAHALTASLSITGEYRNKYIRSSITHDIMVFYDGEQINSGYTIQWSYKGAGKEGENNSSNIFSSWTDEFPTFDTSIRRDGTPLQIRCKVSYKRLEFIATSNLPCIQDGADGVRGAMPNECGAYNPNYTYTSNTSLCDWVYDSSVSPNPNDAPWYACRQSCRGIPLSNPLFWIRVGTPKRIITPEMIAGKIKANQIESDAFLLKFIDLPKNYTWNIISQYVAKGNNYYFRIPEGNIKLPNDYFIYHDDGTKAKIQEGTQLVFYLPKTSRGERNLIGSRLFTKTLKEIPHTIVYDNEVYEALGIKIPEGVYTFTYILLDGKPSWIFNEYQDIPWYNFRVADYFSNGDKIDVTNLSVLYPIVKIEDWSIQLNNFVSGRELTIIIPDIRIDKNSMLKVYDLDNLVATIRYAGIFKFFSIPSGVYYSEVGGSLRFQQL